jgi:hypothetical protein
MKSYIVSKLCSDLSRALSRSGPQGRVDRQRTRMAGPRIEERSVIAELAIAEELSHHRKRTQCERRVDERFLPVQCLDCGAAWKWIFSGIGIHNLRIQLAHRAQALRLTAVAPIQRLAENILSARSVVAEIEPIAGAAQSVRERFLDGPPGFAGVDAADQDVWGISTIVLKGALMESIGDGRPLRSPEDVDAVAFSSYRAT